MNVVSRLFNRRIKGFRITEIVACGCLAILVLSVYLTKTAASREGAAIAAINREIAEEKRRLRLLDAELAHLEQPGRLGSLSAQYLSLGPVPAKREALPDGLPEVARQAGTERP